MEKIPHVSPAARTDGFTGFAPVKQPHVTPPLSASGSPRVPRVVFDPDLPAF